MHDFAELRERMIRRQIESRAVTHPALLEAFRQLPVLVVDELRARHRPEGFENDRMGHTAGLDLPPDHAFAELCEIVHRALLLRNRLRAGAFRWLKTTTCSPAQSPRTTIATWFRCCSVPMRSRSL